MIITVHQNKVIAKGSSLTRVLNSVDQLEFVIQHFEAINGTIVQDTMGKISTGVCLVCYCFIGDDERIQKPLLIQAIKLKNKNPVRG